VVVEPAEPFVDLNIKVLGTVEIFRDPARPFASDAWTTKRSRDIFCSIATSRNRRLAKDLLIDMFWKDEDPAAIEKNFHPTISHIRKALNSQQPLKQNFILFRDGAYQLNPDFSYRIDTEEFSENFAAARAAKKEGDSGKLREALEAAYGIYRGDFMTGVYEDWAEEQRQHYSELFVRVVNALAKLSVSEKRWNDALRYAREALSTDPYREDLHRMVMKVLAVQSKPAAIKKHYENMQRVLKDELGVPPAPETERLFRELTLKQ
jgi:DNA-binding SARP family transcriptional activator